MKRLIYVLYILFFILMAATFYMAFRVHDGLIEEHYYRKSKNYFQIKEKERELGLEVKLLKEPEGRLSPLKVSLRTREGMLTGAKLILIREAVANKKADRAFLLRESSPGVYTAEVEFPHNGAWYLRLVIEHPKIRTERIWKVDIKD